MLKDEDFSNNLQLYLLEITHKDKYICAQDVVDYVALDEVQQRLGFRKASISGQTWLHTVKGFVSGGRNMKSGWSPLTTKAMKSIRKDFLSHKVHVFG